MTLPGSIGIGVLQTRNVRIRGFKVVNAGFDAILIALSSHVIASGNALVDNGDVGVDINGSSWSQAVGNISEHAVPLAGHRAASHGTSRQVVAAGQHR